MRRLLATFTIFALLLSYFAFLSPTFAAAAGDVCIVVDVNLTNNDTASHSANGYFFNVVTSAPISGTYSLTLSPGESGTLHASGFFPSATTSFLFYPNGLVFTGGTFRYAADSECNTFGKIDDGRINAYDLAAPLAAYCTADNGIAVWDIDAEGHGTLAFTVTKADITKGLSDASASGHNVLIAQGLGDSLYALSTNQLTLVGPNIKEPAKIYEFITSGDRCG